MKREVVLHDYLRKDSDTVVNTSTRPCHLSPLFSLSRVALLPREPLTTWPRGFAAFAARLARLGQGRDEFRHHDRF